ncbi:MAG TPA: hypothetical protein VGK30_08480 [Candidatus Binatia bacterium]|jgi:hypothetical protein
MDGRSTLRAALAACAVVSYASLAAASPHHHPHESAILECHQDILDAASTLTGDVQGHLGRCLTHGLDCLVSAANPSSCCGRVAGRCDDDVATIHASEREFERVVSSRACTRVPFADLLAADGLNLGTLADRCACLDPPVTTTSLQGLATCLRRVVEDDAVGRLALLEAPRTREALACLGLDEDFPAATQDQPSLCGTCPATTATASATPSPGPAASATPTALASAPPSATPTVAGTAGATPTIVSTTGSTPIVAPTATGTAGPTAAAPTPSPTAAPTEVATSVPTATATMPPAVATLTPTPSATPTLVPVPSATPTAICGNGIVEGDEECDGAAIDDSSCLEDVCTCDDFCDDAGGTLSCNADCTLNFSNCTAGGCEF